MEPLTTSRQSWRHCICFQLIPTLTNILFVNKEEKTVKETTGVCVTSRGCQCEVKVFLFLFKKSVTVDNSSQSF